MIKREREPKLVAQDCNPFLLFVLRKTEEEGGNQT